MNIILWAAQIFLAILFSYSGYMKSTQTREHLISIKQTGVANLSYPAIRSIGIIELIGVLGIIVPQATNTLPILTSITAFCFAMVMILAAPIHYRRKEYASVALNITVLFISLFVGICRW